MYQDIIFFMPQFIDTNINLKLPYINSELSKHDKMTINNKGEYKNNMDDILNKKKDSEYRYCNKPI